jgi:hypothetical protein
MQEIGYELLFVVDRSMDLVENPAQWLQKNQGQMGPTFGARRSASSVSLLEVIWQATWLIDVSLAS